MPGVYAGALPWRRLQPKFLFSGSPALPTTSAQFSRTRSIAMLRRRRACHRPCRREIGGIVFTRRAKIGMPDAQQTVTRAIGLGREWLSARHGRCGSASCVGASRETLRVRSLEVRVSQFGTMVRPPSSLRFGRAGVETRLRLPPQNAPSSAGCDMAAECVSDEMLFHFPEGSTRARSSAAEAVKS